MRRYGIFIFYNEHGMVGAYVEVLLKSIQEVLDKLIIVINGDIREEQKAKFYNYSKCIFYRKNMGYDGGAYKDVFLNFLKTEKWNYWDEILLFNDTFYGSFYPWKEVFDVMKDVQCDFWGLTSHPTEKSILFDGKIIPEHVQSYFIVIRKRMFIDLQFSEFWKKLKYPTSYKEAVENFEISFSRYFVNSGFTFTSWINEKKKELEIDENLSINNSELMVSLLHFPIFKRKMFMLQKYVKQKEMFQYLVENTEYPLQVIIEDIYQRCIDGKVKPFNPKYILEFCIRYEEIYLFGMGKYAYNIEKFLSEKGIRIKGYIISKLEANRNQVYELKSFQIKSNQGIIVALNKKNFIKVYKELKERFQNEQLMFPEYD